MLVGARIGGGLRSIPEMNVEGPKPPTKEGSGGQSVKVTVKPTPNEPKKTADDKLAPDSPSRSRLKSVLTALTEPLAPLPDAIKKDPTVSPAGGVASRPTEKP